MIRVERMRGMKVGEKEILFQKNHDKVVAKLYNRLQSTMYILWHDMI